MNANMTLTCEVCGNDTDCRVGYSNRTVQPLSFACPHCSSLNYITLDISGAPKTSFEFEGCKPSQNQRKGPFDGRNPFVDLHLDFPVRFGEYVMGFTPFMMAMHDLGSDDQQVMEKMSSHGHRLHQLNLNASNSGEIKTIIRLYNGKNKQLFKKRVGDFLQKEQGSSLKPQDVNACLYTFINFVFLPFVHFDVIKQISKRFSDLIMTLSGPAFDDFMEVLDDTLFLRNLQRDCLKIYPEIYNAEMPIRPVLFLDWVDGYEKAKTAARISTKDFSAYKDLYKDIAEVFGRQLTLVAGINNLLHRGNKDSFSAIDGGTLSSLEKFASKPLSQKFKYLDNCWYAFEDGVLDTGIRNSIAHNNLEYEEITQEVTFYPKGGGLEEAEGETIYFLDFMRMLLMLFREMHNLHHLIRCLIDYELLIINKDA